MNLEGKKILLGITGSIAAYKSAPLARLLIKEGAEVRAIMTESSTEFISKLTMSVLTKNEVFTDIFSDGSWHNHVELGLWADLMIIAPCTAVTMSKMANGLADNMLVATYLSAKCPVYFAPAMDLDMWNHGSTKSNISKLESYGNQIIDVGTGELASGLVGPGRMAEPEDIVSYVLIQLNKNQDFSGKRVLITAGPTYEHLDPVRFIGNYSSGKMGVNIALEMAQRGAKVDLILGPSSQKTNHPNITVHSVVSADQMFKETKNIFSSVDIAIFSAAVADYRPKQVSPQKIKKSGEDLTLELVKTHDIAKELGNAKSANQITVGFALETNNEEENAKAKILKKNLDLIVLNSLADKGAGFGVDTNKVTILYKDGKAIPYKLKSKKEVAKDICDALINLYTT